MSIKHSSWLVIHPIISRYDLSTTIVIYSFTFCKLLAEKPVTDLIGPTFPRGIRISIENTIVNVCSLTKFCTVLRGYCLKDATVRICAHFLAYLYQEVIYCMCSFTSNFSPYINS